MTTLPNLTPAPTAVDDAELIYTHDVLLTPPARKRTMGSLVAYILGPTAGALRGFFGATPIARPASANQAAVAATVGAAVAATGATNTTPYGFTTAAQANDLVARVNELIPLANALKTLTNEQRAALVALGLIKGSA